MHGVSGSGKSSLVFGPTLARPEADLLEGLTMAIIVDQERMGANVRSTALVAATAIATSAAAGAVPALLSQRVPASVALAAE